MSAVTGPELLDLVKNIRKDIGSELNEYAKIQLWYIARSLMDGGHMPVDTGRLINSVKITHFDEATLSFTIGTDVKYAVHIEFGTWKMIAFEPFQLGGAQADLVIDEMVDKIINDQVDYTIKGIVEGL